MVRDYIGWKAQWTVEKFANEHDFSIGKSYEKNIIDKNLLLNEGIALMMSLLIGGAGTPFSNANARLGVGESTTAAAATQTGLQGSTKTFKAMEATYPQIANQTVTFRSVFGANDANNVWQEFTIVNGEDDTGVNLNRKVDNQGTKASGQVWTVDLAITFS